MARTKGKDADTSANLGFEAKLWAAADALRNNMDAAEYKHVVLGLTNGRQLVDHWNGIQKEFQPRLRLKPGLVRA